MPRDLLLLSFTKMRRMIRFLTIILFAQGMQLNAEADQDAPVAPAKNAPLLLPLGTLSNNIRKKRAPKLESEAKPMSAKKVMIVKSVGDGGKALNENVEDVVGSPVVAVVHSTSEDGNVVVDSSTNDGKIEEMQPAAKEKSEQTKTTTSTTPEDKQVSILDAVLSSNDKDLPGKEATKSIGEKDELATVVLDKVPVVNAANNPTPPEEEQLPSTAPSASTMLSNAVGASSLSSPPSELSTYVPSLSSELQFIDFKSLSSIADSSSGNYLGIGQSMQARFIWTPTLWDLTNSTGGAIGNTPHEGPLLPMIYLNPTPCAFRRASDPFYRCLVLKGCHIGQFDVRTSLSIGFDGIFSIVHTVVENEVTGFKVKRTPNTLQLQPFNKMDQDVSAPLDFHCTFSEHGKENVTLSSTSNVRVMSQRPIPSTAQVIKPTTIRTAIVSTMITVEAVLDQPGLRIVENKCKINDEDIVAAYDLGRGLYTLEYEVKEGDTDRPLGKLPFHCEFQDKAGNNATIGPIDLQSWFSVNANPPKFQHVRIVRPQGTYIAHAGDQVVVEMKPERKGLRIQMEKCLLNGIDITASKNISQDGLLFITLNITTGQSDWFAGQLGIDCWIKDQDGNAAHITQFTDNNTLAGDAHTPGLGDYLPNVMLAIGFAVVSVASGQIATLFPWIGMPLITGYLLTGILAGPEVLGLIPERSIRTLRFVDEVSLAVIAISAGRKIYLPKMRGRWKSIGWVLCFLLIIEYFVGAGTILVLHPYINFMKHMHPNQIIAVALMAGTLVCARSPASAVAIVREMKAEGPWTQTVLGVTVLSDVSVIALFALTSLVSGSLLAHRQHTSSVIWVFAAQMILSSLFGWVFGIILVTVLSIPFHQCDQKEKKMEKKILSTTTNGIQQQEGPTAKFGTFLKCCTVGGLGFLMFVMGHMFDPYMQPLITCMVGGFIVANYSNQRKELHHVLDHMTSAVMIAFFTLAGAALNLESLSQTILISTALFLGRIGAIVVGSWLGGWMAGDPPKYNRSYSLGFITQAGVTLGLAKKIHLENRVWGGGFATVIIACVVLNQLVGPVLLRWALAYVDEVGRQRLDSVYNMVNNDKKMQDKKTGDTI